MLNRLSIVLLALALASPAAAEINVITTTEDLAALVRRRAL